MANGQENMLFDSKGDRLLCREVMSQKEDMSIENYILLGCQECSRLVNRLKALAEDSKNE